MKIEIMKIENLKIIKDKYWLMGITFFFLFIPLFISSHNMSILIMCFIMGTLATYFNLTYRTLKYCNFGYAAFYGAGAYFSALVVMRLNISPWFGLLLGALFGAILGLGYSLPILRLRGPQYIAMTSWFFSEVVRLVIIRTPEITRGTKGLSGIPLLFSDANLIPYYYLGFLLFLVSMIIYYKLISSRLGLLWFAIGRDQDLAEMLGVNTLKYKILNLTFSTLFAALMGAFYAHYRGVITPRMLEWSVTLYVLIFAVVGGTDSFWGPIIGAFVLTFFEETFRPFGEFHPIIFGILLLVTILFFPKGIMGIYDIIKTKIIALRGKENKN